MKSARLKPVLKEAQIIKSGMIVMKAKRMMRPAQESGRVLIFMMDKTEIKYRGRVKGSSGMLETRPSTKASERFLVSRVFLRNLWAVWRETKS